MKDGKPPSGLPICPMTHPIPQSTIRAFQGMILHGGAAPSGNPAKTTLGEPKAAGDLIHGTSASFGL